MRRSVLRVGIILGGLLLSACTTAMDDELDLFDDEPSNAPTSDDELGELPADIGEVDAQARYVTGQTITASTRTVFKQSVVDSSKLAPNQKCEVASGTSLKITGSPKDASSQHLHVTLAAALPGCAFKTGYFFKPHLRAESGGNDVVTDEKVVLDVPYFYQYANANEPGRTCNITSTAMAISYLGRRVTPDQIYSDAHGVRRRRGPVFDSGAMALIGRQYGFAKSQALWSTSATRIKQELKAGRPVALQGYFSNWRSGHILLLVGYDATGWYVHDPAGKWNGNTGNRPYAARTATNGKHAHYSYEAVRANSLAGGSAYHVAVFAK
jgi:uncharacterized protein YvpB